MYRTPLAAVLSIPRRAISHSACLAAAAPSRQAPPYNPQSHPNLPSKSLAWSSVVASTRPPLSQPRTSRDLAQPAPLDSHTLWDNLSSTLAGVRRNEVVPPAKRWEAASIASEKQIASLQKPAGIFSGRSVEVTRNNVSGAYWGVMRILTQNNVRAELRRAMRHEKPTDMRRRLKSERHRKRFADQVCVLHLHEMFQSHGAELDVC